MSSRLWNLGTCSAGASFQVPVIGSGQPPSRALAVTGEMQRHRVGLRRDRYQFRPLHSCTHRLSPSPGRRGLSSCSGQVWSEIIGAMSHVQHATSAPVSRRLRPPPRPQRATPRRPQPTSASVEEQHPDRRRRATKSMTSQDQYFHSVLHLGDTTTMDSKNPYEGLSMTCHYATQAATFDFYKQNAPIAAPSSASIISVMKEKPIFTLANVEMQQHINSSIRNRAVGLMCCHRRWQPHTTRFVHFRLLYF